LDALVVSGECNVRYLSGFTGGASFLIVGRDKITLVTDTRFTEQIADECPDLPAAIRPLGLSTVDFLAETLTAMGFRKVGYESSRLTVAELETLQDKAKTIEWASTKHFVEKLRMVKDHVEIAIIRKAIVAAENGYRQFCREVRPNDTEFDLTDRIEMLMRKHGGRAASFEPITAVGERSALAHAPATMRTVSSGAWVLVDWGTVVDGYCSDLTRVLIPHTPLFHSDTAPPLDRPRLEKAWQAVLAGREAAMATIRPGAEGKAVDAAARAAIDKAGFGAQFSHSLGHGIGLEVHEGPGLRMDSKHTLEAGNVITVEPGVYFPGWGGIRIEDDLLVTPDGYEVLSTLPRDLESALI
jgi:Xaa-Pro aminopeptidase